MKLYLNNSERNSNHKYTSTLPLVLPTDSLTTGKEIIEVVSNDNRIKELMRTNRFYTEYYPPLHNTELERFCTVSTTNIAGSIIHITKDEITFSPTDDFISRGIMKNNLVFCVRGFQSADTKKISRIITFDIVPEKKVSNYYNRAK